MTEENNNNSMLHVKGAPFRAYSGNDSFIFISYAHDDAKFVFPELVRFKNKGYNVWYDQGIPIGSDWDAEIEKAIIDCTLFVIFISPNSVSREAVRNEVKMAHDEQKEIVPIYLEETDLRGTGLKLRIGSKQGILKYAMREEQYENSITNAFNAFLGYPEPPKPEIEPPFPAYTGTDQFILAGYDSEDVDLVFPELEYFHNQGFNIRYFHGMDGDIGWDDYIEKALSECALFIMFITPNVAKSKTINNEIMLALSMNKPFITIQLSETELTHGIKRSIESNPSIKKYEMDETQYESEYLTLFKNQGLELPKQFSFRDLDDLIHSGEKSIQLAEDVLIDESEQSQYHKGITIDVDNIVIDGKNHLIDANGVSRIFIITGKNVSIKNLTFKNGYAVNETQKKHSDGGGAIYVDSNASLNLIRCKFVDNTSESDGGAIFNKGLLDVDNKCIFENNSSKTSGGALANFKNSNISKSIFKKNKSFNGGAIYNFYESQLILMSSRFLNNNAEMFAGAVYNYGVLNVDDGTFRNNNSDIGGAILNYEYGEFNGVTFRGNISKFGGAIFNMSADRLATHSFDTANSGDKQGLVRFNECTFLMNEASELGGAICNLSRCMLFYCDIGNNSSNSISHFLSNGSEGIFRDEGDVDLKGRYLAVLSISDCDFRIEKELVKNAVYNQKNCLVKMTDDNVINDEELNQDNAFFLNEGTIKFE